MVGSDSIIAVVLVWLFSVFSSWLSVYQSKGIDWHAPIDSKQKMKMSFTNVSVGLLVAIFCLLAFERQFWEPGVISLIAIMIIAYFLKDKIPNIFKRIAKLLIRKDANPASPTAIEQSDKDANKSVTNNETHNTNVSTGDNKIIDVFSKMITVFNVIFVLLNVGYMLYIYNNSELPVTISHILANDSVLLAHATVLLWTTTSATVVTSLGWNFQEDVSSTKEENRRATHSAEFFTKRITDRNRK